MRQQLLIKKNSDLGVDINGSKYSLDVPTNWHESSIQYATPMPYSPRANHLVFIRYDESKKDFCFSYEKPNDKSKIIGWFVTDEDGHVPSDWTQVDALSQAIAKAAQIFSGEAVIENDGHYGNVSVGIPAYHPKATI